MLSIFQHPAPPYNPSQQPLQPDDISYQHSLQQQKHRFATLGLSQISPEYTPHYPGRGYLEMAWLQGHAQSQQTHHVR